MRLQAGQVAPYFKRTDIGGNVVTLTDFANRKLLLCFFRYAGCPWCNLAIHKLVVEYPKLSEAGLSVVAFVQSPEETIREYIVERHSPLPPFSIIADPNREIYDLYGVESSSKALYATITKIPEWVRATTKEGYKQGKVDGDLSLLPAQFLIGPSRLKVYRARYGQNYGDDMTMDEIVAFAETPVDNPAST